MQYGSKVIKGYRVIESNLQNSELNKVTSPLNKVPSHEEQLTQIRKKYHDKYIIFTNSKQIFPYHPFPKCACVIAGDLMLTGIGKNRLKTGNYKFKVRYFPGARTGDMYDYMKPLLRKLSNNFAH